MTAPSELADACPECFPGDQPASLPLAVTSDGHDGLVADYRCPAGHTWTCGWDAAAVGWPGPRERI